MAWGLAPLVLLHGLLDCGVGWKHLAGVMDRPCYAFDLPGFGDSDRPTRNRISAYAEDVQAALAVLEVHDFTVGRWPPVARMTRVRTGSVGGRRRARWRGGV